MTSHWQKTIADRIGKDGLRGHYRRRTTRDNAKDFSQYLKQTTVNGLIEGHVVESTAGNEALQALTRISDQIKRLVEKEEGQDGWSNFAKTTSAGDELNGTIENISSDHGLFVRLENGPTGLLHHSRLPPGQNLSDFKVGDTIKVEVVHINPARERVALQLA